MPERDWSVTLVALSPSFHDSVRQMLNELTAAVTEWQPDSGTPLDATADVVLLLAGGEESGALELLPTLPASPARRYVIGAVPDHRIAVTAVHGGAQDYFALPDDVGPLRRALDREARLAGSRVDAGRFADEERQSVGLETIVGTSAALQQAIELAARVARHGDLTVLIGGETGTGKELFARAIHYHSPRAAAPFVEINCAAIPMNLLESELFGHERGAFTGAVAAKPGLFELAHGGTLFLDEIATLPLELQPKLLRALESRSIRRVGGQQERRIDVRVLAATHVDLAQTVGRGEFREDLYYRLNVVRLVLPPLRDRGDDVVVLAETFLERGAATYGLPVPSLDPAVVAALRNHPWPGNVRELRNAMERALVLSPPGTLTLHDMASPPVAPPPQGHQIPFPATLRHVVQATAEAMLRLSGGNKSEAARRLDISRSRLQRLLEGNTD